MSDHVKNNTFSSMFGFCVSCAIQKHVGCALSRGRKENGGCVGLLLKAGSCGGPTKGRKERKKSKNKKESCFKITFSHSNYQFHFFLQSYLFLNIIHTSLQENLKIKIIEDIFHI